MRSKVQKKRRFSRKYDQLDSGDTNGDNNGDNGTDQCCEKYGYGSAKFDESQI